jgi:hypothetical protein
VQQQSPKRLRTSPLTCLLESKYLCQEDIVDFVDFTSEIRNLFWPDKKDEELLHAYEEFKNF